MRAAAVAVAVAGMVCAAEAPGPPPPSLFDAAPDAVAARIAVPSEARKVGEVRLVTRGDATVVQTLLATKLLSRVVGEIRRKEEANWPPGTPGRDDMLRYVDGLADAAKALEARRPASGGDRRLRLAIEFAASAHAEGVAFAEFAGDEVDGVLEPRARRLVATLPLGRPYVLRNMRLILADSFHVAEADLARLGPLGPVALPADAAR